jgi:hypothetical protein
MSAKSISKEWGRGKRERQARVQEHDNRKCARLQRPTLDIDCDLHCPTAAKKRRSENEQDEKPDLLEKSPEEPDVVRDQRTHSSTIRERLTDPDEAALFRSRKIKDDRTPAIRDICLSIHFPPTRAIH